MRHTIKLLLIVVLALTVIVVATGCQSQVTPEIPCSIEVTSPGEWESLNGNQTHEIAWDWTGSANKEVNIILIGYTEDGIKLGTMPIVSNVLGADRSYVWGPNFGVEIAQNFGLGDNWPWWFNVRVEVIGDEQTYGLSKDFSVRWDIMY